MEEAKKGDTGEICIRGKTVMKGYFKDEAETKNALKLHSDGEIWLHTGDVGKIDEDGFVYFKGRIKGIIVSNGNNIYPSEIEKALLKHKDIKECCVVGVKDKAKGESAVAFAVMNNKSSETEEEKENKIKQAQIERLTSFKRLSESLIATNDSAFQNKWGLSRNAKPLKDYTDSEIANIMNSGSLEAQQALSRNYFYKDGFHTEKIHIYFASTYSWAKWTAAAPSATAVTICRRALVRTSPTANTPGIFVRQDSPAAA